MNYKHALSTPIFEIISKSAEQLGFDSYAIGGFVRDFILDRDAKKHLSQLKQKQARCLAVVLRCAMMVWLSQASNQAIS